MTKIHVRDVWKEYGSQIVLERLNIEIEDAAFVSLVGPSGCGKSTFLRILLGQEQATRGSIWLDGDPLPSEPGPDRGVVFQRYSVFPHLTVVQNVLMAFEFAAGRFTGRLWGAARRAALAKSDQLLARVGLADHRDKFPGMLSGGMQQRLAIAQALAREPRILLLDEPFGALDPGTRVQMHKLVLELWRASGMTVLVVTHDLHEAFALATRVLTFDKPRTDPQAPERYGATITYDIPMGHPIIAKTKPLPKPPAPTLANAPPLVLGAV
jgi:NitT/TauT family transport system ATP-binding protein